MATYWENSCSFGLRYVSWYKYLIVSLVFSHLGFWSGNLFLIAPFPDLCLLVPFYDFVYYMSNSFAYPHIINLNTQKQYTEPDIALLEFYHRLSPLTYFSLHKHRKDRCIELRIEAVLSICTDQSVIFQYT